MFVRAMDSLQHKSKSILAWLQMQQIVRLKKSRIALSSAIPFSLTLVQQCLR
jgi:hypothetical protein